MKKIYFECEMGIAGDMLMSTLLKLSPNPQNFIDKINYFGIPGISVKAKRQFDMEWKVHT